MLSALAPGILVTIAIGVGAYFVAQLHDVLDALVVALLAGMIVRAAFGKHPRFILIVAFAKDIMRFLLPVGVLLYAATIEVQNALRLPYETFMRVMLSVAVLGAVAVVLGRMLKLSPKTTALTAVGSAICGASAIAVSAGAMGAKDDEISNAIVAVTVAGLIATALYLMPALAGMDRESFAVLAGATLQQTGLVKIIAAKLGALGPGVALPVKVLRTALIPFVALGLALMPRNKKDGEKNRAYLVVVLVAFVVVLALVAFVPSFAAALHVKAARVAATIVFATAFANLGLLVDFKTLRVRPIVAALGAWGAAFATFMLLG